MKYEKISIENIGPIEGGQIKRHKINVFFGPNNSGKSIASRLIHGICQLDAKSPVFQKIIGPKTTKVGMNVSYRISILNNAGIFQKDLLTFGKDMCKLSILSNGSTAVNFGFKKDAKTNVRERILQHRISRLSQTSKDSVYIPAGRTGTMQFFTNITQIRNRLLQDVLGYFPSMLQHDSKTLSAKDFKSLTRLSIKLPKHLEQFYDLILDAHSEILNKDIQDSFSNLFPGSIDSVETRIMQEIVYRDPSGYVAAIESVGSGTMSSFPILLGVYHVKKSGTLIIEEPEAHLEPDKQLKLIEELVKIARYKKIDLIFTTHSDYIVKKLLGMVSSKKIKQNDLGLYYFDRPPGSLTHIEHIPVDKTGEAKQPLFEEALNTLVGEFSE